LELSLRENNPNNHFYFIGMSDAYDQAEMSDIGNEYLRKAYFSLRSNIYDNSQQRILELEKKYDMSRKEYELMKARQEKKLFVAFFAITVLVFIITIIVTYQHRQIQKQKNLLIQEEKEHIAKINVLQKKAINLFPSFVQISNTVLQRNYSLELQEDMDKAIFSLKVALINELSSIFPVEKDSIDYENLSEKEQLIFLLTEFGFSNAEIATILLITEANVRSTKSKIKKKSETF
jgi:DNA-binding CsgD family transcriptional regulator